LVGVLKLSENARVAFDRRRGLGVNSSKLALEAAHAHRARVVIPES